MNTDQWRTGLISKVSIQGVNLCAEWRVTSVTWLSRGHLKGSLRGSGTEQSSSTCGIWTVCIPRKSFFATKHFSSLTLYTFLRWLLWPYNTWNNRLSPLLFELFCWIIWSDVALCNTEIFLSFRLWSMFLICTSSKRFSMEQRGNKIQVESNFNQRDAFRESWSSHSDRLVQKVS